MDLEHFKDLGSLVCFVHALCELWVEGAICYEGVVVRFFKGHGRVARIQQYIASGWFLRRQGARALRVAGSQLPLRACRCMSSKVEGAPSHKEQAVHCWRVVPKTSRGECTPCLRNLAALRACWCLLSKGNGTPRRRGPPHCFFRSRGIHQEPCQVRQVGWHGKGKSMKLSQDITSIECISGIIDRFTMWRG